MARNIVRQYGLERVDEVRNRLQLKNVMDYAMLNLKPIPRNRRLEHFLG